MWGSLSAEPSPTTSVLLLSRVGFSALRKRRKVRGPCRRPRPYFVEADSVAWLIWNGQHCTPSTQPIHACEHLYVLPLPRDPVRLPPCSNDQDRRLHQFHRIAVQSDARLCCRATRSQPSEPSRPSKSPKEPDSVQDHVDRRRRPKDSAANAGQAASKGAAAAGVTDGSGSENTEGNACLLPPRLQRRSSSMGTVSRCTLYARVLFLLANAQLAVD